MKTHQHKHLNRAIALPVICILFCNFAANIQLLHAAVLHSAIRDTIPPAGVANIKPGDSLTIKGEQPDPSKNSDSLFSDPNKIFTKVEIESAYPGGPRGWMMYMNRTFRYPEQAQRKGIQGAVVVQFIVNREGKVSDVEAISGPEAGGLRGEAERVIKNSGRWEPAMVNGSAVKSYKKQAIIFRLETN